MTSVCELVGDEFGAFLSGHACRGFQLGRYEIAVTDVLPGVRSLTIRCPCGSSLERWFASICAAGERGAA